MAAISFPLRLPLSVDWEDWYQLCVPPYNHSDAHEHFPSRLDRSTDLILELCEDLKAKATFFCLVDQAQRHPHLLQRIVSAGHRIGLHGLDHRRAFEFSPEAFRLRTADGRKALQDLSGQPILGFRAPEWSLRGLASDYWTCLPELGFRFDSSRAPLSVIGDPCWPRQPYVLHTLNGPLWEFPPPVLRLLLWSIPLWGWGQRLLPGMGWLSRHRAQQKQIHPLVLHPWELDEDQPPLKKVSWGHRFTHSSGLEGFGRRLRRQWKGIQLNPLEDFLFSEELNPDGAIAARPFAKRKPWSGVGRSGPGPSMEPTREP